MLPGRSTASPTPVRHSLSTLLWLLGLLLVPVAMVGARRYRLSRTRGAASASRSAGRVREFVGIFVVGSVLTSLTLGLYYPVFVTTGRSSWCRNAYFGSQKFDFDGRGRELVRPFLRDGPAVPADAGAVVVLVLGAPAALLHRAHALRRRPASTRRSPAAALAWLQISNFVALVLTLGLAWPWTSVRAMRFTYRYLSLVGALESAAIRQDAQAAVRDRRGAGRSARRRLRRELRRPVACRRAAACGTRTISTAARRCGGRSRVLIGRAGLEITLTDGGGSFRWPLAEVRQTQGFYAGEQVRLERGGELAEALLVRRSSPSCRRCGRPRPRRRAAFHDPAPAPLPRRPDGARRAWPPVGLAVGLYFWGIPALADVAAARVPVAWEVALGDAAMAAAGAGRPSAASIPSGSGASTRSPDAGAHAAGAALSVPGHRRRTTRWSTRSPRRAASSSSSAGCWSAPRTPRSWPASWPTRSSTCCTATPPGRSCARPPPASWWPRWSAT